MDVGGVGVETAERPRRLEWLCTGRRATFLGWLGTLGVIAVCGFLIFLTIQKSWAENGEPDWATAYQRWENRKLNEWGFRWRRHITKVGGEYDVSWSIERIQRVHAR